MCEQYEQLQRAVNGRLPYFQAPDGLEDRIRAQLRLRERVQDVSSKRHWRAWGGWAIAAAVAIFLVLSAVLFERVTRPAISELLAEEVVSDHVRSLMASHLTDVISSDQHTVKPWFTGKLDFAPVVKDLSANGFQLIGGRLDYLSDHPVAALVYKRRQHTINLFIWPSAEADSSRRTITKRGYNVAHWTHGHMNYWAVSDLNAAELNEFANDLQK
jgi:anti-sigma factor RsiW